MAQRLDPNSIGHVGSKPYQPHILSSSSIWKVVSHTAFFLLEEFVAGREIRLWTFGQLK